MRGPVGQTHLAPWLFISLLIGILVFVMWRGGRDERIVAAVCLIGYVMTQVVIAPINERFQNVELGVLAVDLMVLGGFLAVALRSYRFWPLWVTGLQLTTILGHILKGLDTALIPQAYGAALTFWSYPILAILLIGTWRSHQRSRRDHRDSACSS